MSDENGFNFGKNWERFVKDVDEIKIRGAVESLQNALKIKTLEGKAFLDVGCGSGLFSLAAMRLKADRVISFDCSERSVSATKVLKAKYYEENKNWIIMKGSVLDREMLSTLGSFDVVYSWGVLHHTGDMYHALENVVELIRENGKLFIAIYNDQGIISAVWKKIKLTYNKLPNIFKMPYVFLIASVLEFMRSLKRLLKGQSPFRRLSDSARGMSGFIDWVDWIGGYPFEVAKPEEIFNFYYKRGFILEVLKTCGGKHGNNEFVFRKIHLNDKL
ncbi:MAG: class I SAM-dependent methyltransferase [Elusimicrobia bacterium]|nr:class I SAM-dependent methyltransferase [Elusimicrobiota bacterium]